MITKPLTDAKRDELEAELTLYREGGVKDVAEFKLASKNADRLSEIERLQKEHGIPVKVDAAFIQGSPELVAVVKEQGEDLKEGEVVFFSPEELQLDEEARNKEPKEHEEPKEEPKEEKKEEPVSRGSKELVYRGSTVVSTVNRLMGGKSYKEVICADGQGYTLSLEEYEKEVKPRGN